MEGGWTESVERTALELWTGNDSSYESSVWLKIIKAIYLIEFSSRIEAILTNFNLHRYRDTLYLTLETVSRLRLISMYLNNDEDSEYIFATLLCSIVATSMLF